MYQFASCYAKYQKALSFSFAFIKVGCELYKTKKKALAVSCRFEIIVKPFKERFGEINKSHLLSMSMIRIV